RGDGQDFVPGHERRVAARRHPQQREEEKPRGAGHGGGALARLARKSWRRSFTSSHSRTGVPSAAGSARAGAAWTFPWTVTSPGRRTRPTVSEGASWKDALIFFPSMPPFEMSVVGTAMLLGKPR